MKLLQGLGSAIKILFVEFITTILLLFLIAFLMYKLELKDSLVDFLVIFVYILSAATGGLFMGKEMKKRKYLWGLLAGCMYFIVMAIISAFVTGGMDMLREDGLSLILLCAGGGMLGGMVA